MIRPSAWRKSHLSKIYVTVNAVQINPDKLNIPRYHFRDLDHFFEIFRPFYVFWQVITIHDINLLKIRKRKDSPFMINKSTDVDLKINCLAANAKEFVVT